MSRKRTIGGMLMTEERKGVLFVFVAAVLYSLGGLCIKLIPDWSGLESA